MKDAPQWVLAIVLFVFGVMYLIARTGDVLGTIAMIVGLVMLVLFMSDSYHRRDK